MGKTRACVIPSPLSQRHRPTYPLTYSHPPQKKNAERLGEALEVALQDEAVAKAHPTHTGKPRPPNPLMLGLPAPRYILFHLRLVKGPDLEQALLVLTLDAIRQVRAGV